MFRLSFDAKEVKGAEEIHRVLDNIHHNAVSGKWNLAENFMDYKYSSARYYELGESRDVEIYHYLDVLNISEFPADNSEGL